MVEESTTVNGVLNSVTQYSYGHDLISQRRWSNSNGQWTTHFFGYDGHGSVRFLTDKDGNVTDTLDYDAFGILVDRTGTTPLNYMYAGEQWDSDLGMYYNRARYLNVGTGRFWSMDSFEGGKNNPLSLHKYLYTNNNPVNGIDPSGYATMLEKALVVGIGLIIATMPACTTNNDSASQTPATAKIEKITYDLNPVKTKGFQIEIELGARIANKGKKEFNWRQVITTDYPIKNADGTDQTVPNVPFEDPQPPNDAKPFYYTDSGLENQLNQKGYDLTFYDGPKRQFTQDFYWKAVLQLVEVTPKGSSSFRVLNTITYGFTYSNSAGAFIEELIIDGKVIVNRRQLHSYR